MKDYGKDNNIRFDPNDERDVKYIKRHAKMIVDAKPKKDNQLKVASHNMAVGESVKDINPSCPHFGAKGKVVKSYPHKITFIVSNKGSKYNPGDKLTKTIDQMVKTSGVIKDLYVAAMPEDMNITTSFYGRKAAENLPKSVLATYLKKYETQIAGGKPIKTYKGEKLDPNSDEAKDYVQAFHTVAKKRGIGQTHIDAKPILKEAHGGATLRENKREIFGGGIGLVLGAAQGKAYHEAAEYSGI